VGTRRITATFRGYLYAHTANTMVRSTQYARAATARSKLIAYSALAVSLADSARKPQHLYDGLVPSLHSVPEYKGSVYDSHSYV